jgi:oligopeptide/dipeptide ABC transporter ATP-binding protein
MSTPIVELDAVTKRYGATLALDRLSLCFTSGAAPIVAVAGESGSGKTTLASLLLGFIEPSEGEVRFRGRSLAALGRAARRDYRRNVQAVFQDPFAVYNPFYRVDHALLTPLKLFGLAGSTAEARAMMVAACERVGLHPEDTLGRFPHELSGGQRQRLMIARALLLAPQLLVADEPVSMIDASLRAIVLRSLRQLNRELQIPIVYITHDLATAYHIADTILVLYRGRVVEAGDAAAVIATPQHPYTRLLVGSIPWPDLDRRWGDGQPILREEGSPATQGCVFVPRCSSAMPICSERPPTLNRTGPDSVARCFLHGEAAAAAGPGLDQLLRTSSRLPNELETAS